MANYSLMYRLRITPWERYRTAAADWELLSVDRADTRGPGWPMNLTAPRWYRLRRRP